MFTILALVVPLAFLGCAAQSISSRPVHSEASWFVRLDSFNESPAASDLYDHPVDLTEAELALILSRLLFHQSVGILEEKPPPRPVFDPHEVRQLSAPLKEAFRRARPSEWISFYLASPKGVGQEVTSGGFFVKGGELHVLIPNIRAQNLADATRTDATRADPMYVLSGRGTAVSFEQSRYVLATRSRWTGGSSTTPASELILDYQAFLADARPPAPAPVAIAPVAPAPAMKAPPPTNEATSVPLPKPPPIVPQAGPKDETVTSLKDRMTSLQNEVERLRRKVEEQGDEIVHLKTRLTELDMLMKNPPK